MGTWVHGEVSAGTGLFCGVIYLEGTIRGSVRCVNSNV